MNLTALIFLWIFIGIFLILTFAFGYLYFYRKKLIKSLIKEIESYKNYRDKFLSFNIKWLSNLMKISNSMKENSNNTNLADIERIKDQYDTWKNVQIEWLMNLNHYKKAISSVNFKEALSIAKSIDYCKKHSTQLLENFMSYANQLLHELQKENMKLKLLSFNQALEEMNNYIKSEAKTITDSKNNLSKIQSYREVVMKYVDQISRKTVSKKDIETFVTYARIMINYHQFILSQAQWKILFDMCFKDDWIKNDRYKFIHLNSLQGKIDELVSNFDVMEIYINNEWKIINNFQEYLIDAWRLNYFIKWKENNLELVRDIYKNINKIKIIYDWYSDLKNKYNRYYFWLFELSENWLTKSKELITRSEKILSKKQGKLNKKTNTKSISFWSDFNSICSTLLEWIEETSQLINNIMEFSTNQCIIEYKKANQLSQLDYLNREYTPNRDELFYGQKVIERMTPLFSNDDERLLDVAAITINMFLDYNYKQQSFEFIARELWMKINNPSINEMFTDEEWERISNSYKNIEYKKFIEQTVKIFIKLKTY